MRDIIVKRRAPRPLPRPRFPRGLAKAAGAAAALLVVLSLAYAHAFGPADPSDHAPRDFVVEPGHSFSEVAAALKEAGLAKHEAALAFAALASGAGPVKEGGYRIAPSMDAWTVVHTLAEAPYLAWVVIPEGKRKEETAAIFAAALGWDEEETQEYLAARSVLPEYPEGVYAPGTYLMPSDLAPALVAERLRTKFQDSFAPYFVMAAKEGKDFKEVLALASIIERESAKHDKRLVAGILANRLERGMKLQADATMQYATGNPEEGWWHAPEPDDKFVESPFNTYIADGLPPAPIATPTAASIEAALDPEETSCLYYLHDARGRIHCSPSYRGHLANVEAYLR